MSFEQMNRVWHYTGYIPSGLRFTAIALANQAKDNGACFPSIRTIARRTGYSPNTVRKHLKTLQDAGLIGVTPRYRKDGTRTSNKYHMRFPTPTAATVPSTHPPKTGRKIP